MPSEERVMRAREVVIAALMREPPWNDLDRKEQERRLAIVIPSLSAAFSDEGSGIEELREALRPYLQHKVGCRNRLRMGQRDCSCGLSDILSPDIDRSGLAQEVN